MATEVTCCENCEKPFGERIAVIGQRDDNGHGWNMLICEQCVGHERHVIEWIPNGH